MQDIMPQRMVRTAKSTRLKTGRNRKRQVRTSDALVMTLTNCSWRTDDSDTSGDDNLPAEGKHKPPKKRHTANSIGLLHSHSYVRQSQFALNFSKSQSQMRRSRTVRTLKVQSFVWLTKLWVRRSKPQRTHERSRQSSPMTPKTTPYSFSR